MGKIFFCLLQLVFLFPLTGQCQQDSVIKNILSKVKSFNTNLPTEKAYLQFDKPYYAAGDTIYFKVYVTLGQEHLLSTKSSVINIELIDANNKINKVIKLPLTGGITWGDITLPDSLSMGNYRIRAFTRWMRNEGEEVFFDQTIPIGNIGAVNVPNETKSTSTKKVNSQNDIQFLPEGGELVSGVHCKVAFKALDKEGKGVEVKGIITNKNRQVASFKSNALGMGFFYTDVEEGAVYKADVVYADGSRNISNFAEVLVKSVSIAVMDSTDRFTVAINSSKSYYRDNKNKKFFLLILEGGKAVTVKGKFDSTTVKFDVQKQHLSSGVMQITLFSEIGEPLSERLVFVQNPDLLRLSVNSSKTTSGKHEKVLMNVKATNAAGIPIVGHFSVSITDESKVPLIDSTGQNILTYLLLTSDIKGNIEKPGHYFSNTEEARKDLDILMLTHGYRRFIWKRVLEDNQPQLTFAPETGLEINGFAKTLAGKPLKGGLVSLISTENGLMLNALTNDKGEFSFNNLYFMDSVRFVLSATNAKGRNSTRLIYNKEVLPSLTVNNTYQIPSNTNELMASYLKNKKLEQIENLKFGLNNSIKLKAITIVGKKIDNHYYTSSRAGAGNADLVIHAKELSKISGLLSTRILAHLPGKGVPPIIIIDGVRESSLDDLSADDVETVEILRKGANSAIYSDEKLQFADVVIITTKRAAGTDKTNKTSTGILPIIIKGFYKAKEFYSPKYNYNQLKNFKEDLRSTIFWKPNVVTDNEGNAFFEYYNAGNAANYRVVIEGIDASGNLGRAVYKYKVE